VIINPGGSVAGGGSSSYIKGKLRQTFTALGSKLFLSVKIIIGNCH
jgi:hypothetical protein